MIFPYGTCETTFVNDKSQFPYKLICLPRITSNGTNEFSEITIAVQVCPSASPFVFAMLFIPSYNFLRNFLVSLNRPFPS